MLNTESLNGRSRRKRRRNYEKMILLYLVDNAIRLKVSP